MTRYGDWHKRAMCPHCGWHDEAPFGSVYHLMIDCCPKCGHETPGCVSRHNHMPEEDHWDIITMRWVYTSTWYNPWSWGDGHWQCLEELKGAEKVKNMEKIEKMEKLRYCG